MSRPFLRRALAAAAVVLCAQASQAGALASAQTGGQVTARVVASPRTVATELDVQPAALTHVQLTALLDRLRADRISTVSTGVNWGSVRPLPAPAGYSWAALDDLVQQARTRGLQVRLRVAGSPAWLHPGVPAANAAWYPPAGPTELMAWSGFLTDLAQRYGSRVSAVEIWNEPDESDFWKPSPDPAAYAVLLRTSYLAIKRVAPRLTVTSGGLSHNDLGYLSAYYDAAARFPDASADNWYFDQLGMHPYSGARSPDLVTPTARYQGDFGTIDENFLAMRSMVALMTAREGRAKHIWISEFGYTTVGTTWIPAIPDSRRAYFLMRAYSLAESLGFVDGLGWYHSHPTPWDPPGYDILTATGTTETYEALRRTTGVAPVATPLLITLGSQVRGNQEVLGSRVGLPKAPVRMELYVDGALVANGTSIIQWSSQSTSNGEHNVQLVAWTADGTTHMSQLKSVLVSN